MLNLIAYDDEKRRNQVQIQEPCRILDEALLNVEEFLDPSLKTSPCTKTSMFSCEYQFFFLFRNLVTFIERHFIFSVAFYRMMKYF